MNICEVCKKNESIGVFSSCCGPISARYCQDCINNGAEPYGYLVAYISMVVSKGEDAAIEKNKIRESYQKIIDTSLEIAGKTRQDFYKDIDSILEEERIFYEGLK